MVSHIKRFYLCKRFAGGLAVSAGLFALVDLPRTVGEPALYTAVTVTFPAVDAVFQQSLLSRVESFRRRGAVLLDRHFLKRRMLCALDAVQPFVARLCGRSI